MAAKRAIPRPSLSGLALQYDPICRGEVKQHWNVTFAHQKRISVYGKRILARVFSQLQDDDHKLRPFYQLSIAAILEGTDVEMTTAYAKVKDALYELADVQWEFERLDKSGWHAHPLLDAADVHRVRYQKGIITVSLNPQLKPYLLQPTHYSRYPLARYLNLKSWYSMRLFELLAAWRDKGYWEVTVEDYRRYVDCWYEYDPKGQLVRDKLGKPVLKYATTALLIAYTLQEPVKELATTEYAFTFTPVYETTRPTSGRKRIVRFRFELERGKPLTSVPDSWLTHADTGGLIQRLREWQVTEHNIVTYARSLGQEGIKALLRAWEQKNRSNRHIDDKIRYCNAAFVRAGKTAEAEAQQHRAAEQQEAKKIGQALRARN